MRTRPDVAVRWGAGIAIATVAIVLDLPALGHGFVVDDHHLITGNPHVEDPSRVLVDPGSVHEARAAVSSYGTATRGDPGLADGRGGGRPGSGDERSPSSVSTGCVGRPEWVRIPNRLSDMAHRPPSR